MGIDMNLVDEQLGPEIRIDASEIAKATLADDGAEPSRSTSSRLALTGRERLALMNETGRWGEVGRQKPVLEVE